MNINLLCRAVRSLFVAGLLLYGARTSLAASAGNDDAGNYTVGTFTNGSNLGTGFGAWQFTVGTGASVDLADSTSGSGNINSTNGLSFRFYGGVGGTYGEATRDFNAALSVGDQFSVVFAYNWDGGARGVNILNASGGELMNVNLGGSNTLSFNFAGSSATVLSTSYSPTATVTLVVQQLTGNQLDVTITRNDGLTTNFVSSSLTTPAAKVKFYNGGHSGDNVNYALFVNDLVITPNATLGLDLSGIDAMAAGMTNLITLNRYGTPLDAITVTLSNSDPAVASIPTSVTFAAGATSTNFPIVGLGNDEVVISASASNYVDDTFAVDVFDIAYDGAAYYPPANFTNGAAGGGSGYQAWLFIDNNGPGEGYTNFAGGFVGDSTFGGVGLNVNDSSGQAFGLYANGSTTNAAETPAPSINVIRIFSNELAIGQVVSTEIGINFRNGSKGMKLQNAGNALFEVAAFSDDYWYAITNGTPVSLGWAYASDTAIEISAKRTGSSTYDISIKRRGSSPQLTELTGVDLGASAISEAMFYCFDTDGSGAVDNLYFNRLGIRTAPATLALKAIAGAGIVTLTAGPTDLGIDYDIYETTNLLASPQVWTAVGFTIPGNGSNVTATVTNSLPMGIRRIGQK